MNPPSGTRLIGGPGAVYEVTGPGWDGPRHTYLRALRRFRNFRYPADALDEAPADEALGVLIRRPLPGSDPGGERSAFERGTVLTIPRAPCFLEWVDVIDPTGSDTDGPSLVFADPHAGPVGLDAAIEPGAAVVLVETALAMIDAVHQAGLAVGALGLEDFLAGGQDRWFYLGTDRLTRSSGPDDTRGDLSHWARLTVNVLGGGAGEGRHAPAEAEPGLDARGEGLLERARLCLAAGPSGGPASVAELERDFAGLRGPVAALRRFFRRPSGGG